MREFDLLQRIYAANVSLGERVAIPPGDDLAQINLTDRRLLVGVDQLVVGRHVNAARTSIEQIARKAIARSVSDIAAMAGRPLASLVAAVLPPDFGQERAGRFADALRESAAELDCPLIGGDVAFHSDPSHPLICSVTVLAEPASDHPITRSGALVGDTVYVTGELGGAVEPDGTGRHLTFAPRVKEAIELATNLGGRLHAMIDISDGLGRDASHIAESSGTQIRIDAGRLPRHEDLDWQAAMSGGEDYELCFTAAGEVPARLGEVPVTAIGEVVESPGEDAPLVLVQAEGREVRADELGWQHES
ncbi:MAG: thiamine-phosphate kinase [Phycisphaerales bacterium]|nr:MAG: thiamine-phosphate kinase [Phycisphaerales bacterium]